MRSQDNTPEVEGSKVWLYRLMESRDRKSKRAVVVGAEWGSGSLHHVREARAKACGERSGDGAGCTDIYSIYKFGSTIITQA